jgi:DNA-binding NarL/FixJ family response regulator
MSLVVCDDHEMFLAALVEALVSTGHEVAGSTADPSEVADLVRRHRPALVMLDVQLPGMSGVEVARRLRAVHPQVRIVLLTGSTEDWVREVYDSGAVDGLVNKASGVRVLDGAIRRVLEGERTIAGWPAAAPPTRRTNTLDLLTDREREVLTLLADGASTAAMAQSLGVSVNTVRTHVRNVFHKLGVHHRTMAAHAAFQQGLAAAG